jgi:hypothetical protein
MPNANRPTDIRPIRVRMSRVTLAALLIATASLVSIPASLGAAAAVPAQTCTAPGTTDQAGRQSFAPGINGLATVQTFSAKIHLFHCTGKPATGGSGMLRISLKTAAVTCSVFTTAHVWKTTATINWKNKAGSTGSISFATSGASRKAIVTGTISTGLFAGHSITGEFKWAPLVSPVNQKFPTACANTVGYGDPGRASVVGDVVFRTKAFTIT